MKKSHTLTLAIFAATALASIAAPLKVYVLAGQSNMEGTAKLATFKGIGLDPKTKPMLGEMQDAPGKYKVLDDTFISYVTGKGKPGSKRDVKSGPLTVGYGARFSKDNIGPEYTFGIYMDKATEEKILIIKAAWGGKSLGLDFRPPSAGRVLLDEKAIKRYQEDPKTSPEKKQKELDDRNGLCYRIMVDHVKNVLKDPGQIVPGYDPKEGYEMAGFVWFQGYNDMINNAYGRGAAPGQFDEYSRLLELLIEDVRKDLSAPKMPFVIGVLGVGGRNLEDQKGQNRTQNFQNAMAAPAKLPKFKGNVAAVHTGDFWDYALADIEKRTHAAARASKKELYGTDATKKDYAELRRKRMDEAVTEEDKKHLINQSNGGYHYFGSAKTFGQIGKAFAEAMLELQK